MYRLYYKASSAPPWLYKTLDLDENYSIIGPKKLNEALIGMITQYYFEIFVILQLKYLIKLKRSDGHTRIIKYIYCSIYRKYSGWLYFISDKII